MNNKFDELTKSVAQSVTRRAALKKFSVGLAGMAVACFGLANVARGEKAKTCATNSDCHSGQFCSNGVCTDVLSDCDRCIFGCMLGSKGTSHGTCVQFCKQQGVC